MLLGHNIGNKHREKYWESKYEPKQVEYKVQESDLRYAIFKHSDWLKIVSIQTDCLKDNQCNEELCPNFFRLAQGANLINKFQQSVANLIWKTAILIGY